MKKTKTVDLVLCALFAALTAVLSQFAIPLEPVPINMAHISVFMAAGLLGARYSAISQTVFVLLGAVGLPVFSGYSGGIGVLFGPTGGYIVGYIACAFIAGLICEHFGKKMTVLVIAMALGLMATYILGTLWFVFITKMGFIAALSYCVIPFLPGAALKIMLSSVLVNRLYPILQKTLIKTELKVGLL